MRTLTPVNKRKNLSDLLAEISESIPDKDKLSKDVDEYMMKDLNSLPAFNEDGSVVFYDLGGVLLGKSALVRFMDNLTSL